MNKLQKGLFLTLKDMGSWEMFFFWEMKFVLSNFLSNEHLSISYESLDVQLTFDNLINAFRFKE